MGFIREFFKLGEKGGNDVVAEIENGAPRKDQPYKIFNAAGVFQCYSYSCRCAGETYIQGDRFAFEEPHRCVNCGQIFNIAEWLKRDMQAARVRQAQETQKAIKTGAFTKDEERAADNRIPWRRRGGTGTRQVPIIAVPENEGGVIWTGSGSERPDDPDSGGVGFGNPRSRF